MTSIELTEPSQRLLLALLEQAFSDRWRTADDFLRHFPPSVIISSLASEEDVRVKLLTATTGMHERLARRKSLESGGDDLGLALEERTTTPNEVMELYPASVRVACLPAPRLWQFLTEERFWSDGPRNDRVSERLVFTLEAALTQGVMSVRDIFDGIGFEPLSKVLSKSQLEQLLVRALEGGRKGAPLTEEVLLDVVPLRGLVDALSPQDLWERVVVPQIAAPCGYESASGEAPAPRAQASSTKAAPVEAAGPAQEESAHRPKAETLSGEELLEIDSPEEEGPIGAARERLRKIERLPRDPNLPLAVLSAIESMYDDIKDATSDDERMVLIREAFPNATYLRIGILALIDLLDPSIDIQDPTIRAAEMDALLKIVLFEERKRRGSMRPASLPPPAAASRSRSLAPPPRSKKPIQTAGRDDEVEMVD